MSTLGAAAAQSTAFVQTVQPLQPVQTGDGEPSTTPGQGNARVATAFDTHADLLELSTHDVLSAVRSRGQLAQAAAEEASPGVAHSQVAARYAQWSGAGRS